MKKLFSISAISILVCICAAAADTNGLLSGADWLEITTAEKLMYIHAVHDVAVVSPIFVVTKVQKGREAAATETLGALNDFVLTGLYPREVMAALDGFYNNPSNVRVPTLLAIRWTKLKGSERDAEAARLRAAYPQDGKQ